MCGLLFSLFIEISQQFVVRNTDIDDLILNTFGVYLGYLLYAAAKHIINRSKKSEEL
jgi:glycopeptide antibiotics resistance protein